MCGGRPSQVWANLYLDSFDHWVKEQLRVPAYLRFVDDFVLLHDSKEFLENCRVSIRERLGTIRLLMHEKKSVLRPTLEGLPFLGYVVTPSRIRVRGETVRRYRRRAARAVAGGRTVGAGADVQEMRARSLAAWRGHVQLAGSWRRIGGLD